MRDITKNFLNALAGKEEEFGGRKKKEWQDFRENGDLLVLLV